MKTEVRICGLGGQGVVLAGQILGKAAAYDGKSVVQTQTYGAEARGSAAKSEVIISDDRIGFPMVRKCDVLIALSQEAVDKNIIDLKDNGKLLIDISVVEDVPETRATVHRILATQIAEKSSGDKLYANMVMLGALTLLTGIVSVDSMNRAIADTVSAKAKTANLQAFRKGLEG